MSYTWLYVKLSMFQISILISSLTLWLGNWQSTEVMLLAYCAMTFRIAFSTVTGIRPATLVMISCSSRRGRDGSRRVFISVSIHFFSCNGISIVSRPNWTLISCYFESDQWISVLTFWLKYGSGRQYPSIIFTRFSRTLWNTWWSLSPAAGKGSWDGNGSVFGFTWGSRPRINISYHRWQYVYKLHQ